MIIRVDEIPDGGREFEFESDVQAEGMPEARLSVAGKLVRLGPEVILKADARAEMTQECSRCLDEFGYRLDVPVDMAFDLTGNEAVSGDEEYELSEGELNAGLVRDGALDLKEVVMEQIVLAMPMKPLCTDACKGLCPRCGANLNTEPCGCRLDTGDHRFRELGKLLDKGKD